MPVECHNSAVTNSTSEVSGPKSPVVTANQRVHATLAGVYNETEPHFRAENKAKVRRRLESLAESSPSTKRLLDLGCGTGFVLSLASDLFERLDGIDATPEMLHRVDCSPGNIFLHEGIVEKLPFESNTFDLVTAYSFLDHLEDHRAVLREANRVLRPGGKLYVDLVPNRTFWDAVYVSSTAPGRPFGSSVEREIHELVNHEEKLQTTFGIDPLDWRLAEPAKSDGKGFLADELLSDAKEAGFGAEIRHEWFLGQAPLMHETSFEAAEIVDNHLRSLLPVSGSLFKYLVLTGTKQ
jgi:ubiquinone/menaquinone biosynthesis C-methylase UbiE